LTPTLPGRLRGVRTGSSPFIPAAQATYGTMADDLERA